MKMAVTTLRLDRAIGTTMKAIGAVVLAVGVIGFIYILINGPTTTETFYRGNGRRVEVTEIDWGARFNLGIPLFLYCFVVATFTASFGAIISLLHRQVTLTEAATRAGATHADDEVVDDHAKDGEGIADLVGGQDNWWGDPG
jgi:membrane protease YdiL (CAAX protease family)